MKKHKRQHTTTGNSSWDSGARFFLLILSSINPKWAPDSTHRVFLNLVVLKSRRSGNPKGIARGKGLLEFRSHGFFDPAGFNFKRYQTPREQILWDIRPFGFKFEGCGSQKIRSLEV
jgi:hypothetical protein